MKYFIFLFFAYTQASSQMPDYFVYIVRGEAAVQKGNAKPVKLKQHQLVFPSETIVIKNGAELTLSNKEAEYLVLNKPGNYKVNALSKLKPKPIDNVTKKYLVLLYHELLDPNHDYSKFKKENLGALWGGVSRGECNNLVFPIKETKTAERKIQFKWRKTSAVNTYNLKLYNNEAKELVSIAAKDSFLTVDLAQYIPGLIGKYYWLVQGVKADCEEEIPMAFELISKKEEEKIVRELERSGTDIAHKLAIINELENYGLIITAHQYFCALLKTHNSNTTLAKTYTWFLLKYGFEDEAAKVWESSVFKKEMTQSN